MEVRVGAVLSPAIDASKMSNLDTNDVSELVNSPSLSPIKVVSFEIRVFRPVIYVSTSPSVLRGVDAPLTSWVSKFDIEVDMCVVNSGIPLYDALAIAAGTVVPPVATPSVVVRTVVPVESFISRSVPTKTKSSLLAAIDEFKVDKVCPLSNVTFT